MRIALQRAIIEAACTLSIESGTLCCMLVSSQVAGVIWYDVVGYFGGLGMLENFSI